ncbi:3-deoxy-D-manno-octulosonic acid transferase [Niveibacterium terrae]|uniref:3-deoxy-D-manno-octulosonic acid transferase n=1 Tax=Niveibacterium terrae TaxID=3373598 RepID=UPI003A8F7FE8
MQPSPGTLLRWAAFRTITMVAANGEKAPEPELTPPVEQPAVWIFLSTIGELHAIEPFLIELAARTAGLKWVLLSDRNIYREAYCKRFPEADVIEIGEGLDEARRLARLRPPKLFVIAEIPLQPSDAPCRLAFAWLLEAARRGASLVAVNGWLYGYPPSCRSDALERRLFGRAWLSLFDRICVQNQDIADRLIASGAASERITVTGNIKFDALDRSQWQPEQSHSPRMLADLVGANRPLVVAGCVTDADEQELILSAFAQLKAGGTAARLVIAPRHPENPEVMASLASACAKQKIHSRLRSELADAALDPDVECLILDTMGDLRHFYGAASIAHVGRNHNVLEPLAFSVPVTVCSPWETTYPSYPVYLGLKTAAALIESNDSASLASAWRAGMGTWAERQARGKRLTETLNRMAGASARTLAAIDTPAGI